MNKVTSLFVLALTSCGIIPPDKHCSPTHAETHKWRDVERVNTAAAYRHYIEQYPFGCYAYIAAQRIRNPVDEVVLTPAPARGGGSGSDNNGNGGTSYR